MPHHSKTDNKIDRVSYVIPYTSIIDQNAETVREILEDKDKADYLNKVVLEHHSNLTPDEETLQAKSSMQNWDALPLYSHTSSIPETLFGSGTRSARRMPTCKFIIIFVKYKNHPTVASTCSTSQSDFLFILAARRLFFALPHNRFDKIDPAQSCLKIQPEQKIIPYEKELFKKLRRVEVFDRRKIGGWNEEEVAKLADQ